MTINWNKPIVYKGSGSKPLKARLIGEYNCKSDQGKVLAVTCADGHETIMCCNNDGFMGTIPVPMFCNGV